MTDESIFKKSAKAVIGNQKVDILNTTFCKRERDQVPGPGKYQRLSDFNQNMN